MDSIGTPILWAGFLLLVLILLFLDLAVFHRKAHQVSIREALFFSLFWIGLAVAFNIGVYFWFGAERALEFTAGYLLEKALSVDNLFVILLLFSYFRVPSAHQHRVLFWGILGALVMRGIFIFAGAALLHRFHWLIYVFGAFLIWTGAKLLWGAGEIEPEKNVFIRWARRILPMTNGYRDGKFFVKEKGRNLATPLFLVLLTVEGTDVIFAIDSIPAIFAVTKDSFIVFTSNIFAILGLRALFFLLAGVMEKFYYLKVGLALVLGFVGVKMLLSGSYPIPITISLGVIVAILSGAMIASLVRARSLERAEAAARALDPIKKMEEPPAEKLLRDN